MQRAWLAAMAAALGVSEAACRGDAKDGPAGARDVSTSATSSASVALTEPSPSSSASEAQSVAADPSAAPSASVAVTAPSTAIAQADLQRVLGSLPNGSCGARLNQTCGAPLGTGTVRSIGNMRNQSCGAMMPRSDTSGRTTAVATIQTILGGGIAGDDSVVGAVRPQLRACANHALQSEPTLSQGKIIVSLVVDPSGQVTSSTVASNVGLSQSGAACMAMRMRALRFPAGAARTLTVAIVQSKSNT